MEEKKEIQICHQWPMPLLAMSRTFGGIFFILLLSHGLFSSRALTENAASHLEETTVASSKYVVAMVAKQLGELIQVAETDAVTTMNWEVQQVFLATKVDSLEEILTSVAKATDLVSHIATASNDQATSIAQITQGIEQVSQVVQTNSAMAEESAAASQELSGQAELLKRMIAEFKLKNKTVGPVGIGQMVTANLQTTKGATTDSFIQPQILLDERDKY